MTELRELLKQYKTDGTALPAEGIIVNCKSCNDLGSVNYPGKPGLTSCPDCDAGEEREAIIQRHRFNQTELPEDYRNASLDKWLSGVDPAGKLMAFAAMVVFAKQHGHLTSHDIIRAVLNIAPEHTDKLTPFLDNDPVSRHGVVLTGDLGLGKSYLAAAALNALRHDGKRVRFLRLQTALNDLSSTWKRSSDESASKLINDYQTVPYLLIDDFQIGNAKPHDWQLNYVEMIIRHRVQSQLPLLITTNLNKQAFTNTWGEWTADVIAAHCEWITVRGVKARKTAQILTEVEL